MIYTFPDESMAISDPEPDVIPVKYVYETSAPVNALYLNTNILNVDPYSRAGKVLPDTAGPKPIV
jgi:hypothetical protein